MTAGPPPVLEDPAAAHQIRIRRTGRGISVSCTCQNAWTGTWRVTWSGGLRPNPRWKGTRCRGEAIETRPLFPAAEAITAWRAWHEKHGVAL